ncbi:MAG: TIGR00282 family metallophosphoesterase [Nitrospirae bacterium]|nr:TIGR00282 family metallophosphoesterase [Nitrospirota bacterium]
MEKALSILFIGDVVGEAGRSIIARNLDGLVRDHKIDMVVANVENAAAGFGITPKIAEGFFQMGVHVLTSGNHIWDKKEIQEYIVKEDRLLRPANYPEGVPGSGSVILKTASGVKVAVLNLMGRVFMGMFDCPFVNYRRELGRLRGETPIILVDFHAEATSEKRAFGWYADGEVSAVIGTHTHVQTADEQILPKGTAYLTDVGMTGPTQSVIGIDTDMVIEKFLTQMPKRFDVAKGPTLLSAAVIKIAREGGRAQSIKRIQILD